MTIRKLAYPLLMACLGSINLPAQVAPPRVTITKIAKFKPPVVKTYLGRNSNIADVTLEEANELINLPLKITDDKNNLYTISSYQFLYKRKGVVENEQTGKKEVMFTNVADLFKTTPLPQVWRSNIGGGLQKDEELYFFDIMVKDKLNRIFYAPDIKIRIHQ
jgi:hypothetical protein